MMKWINNTGKIFAALAIILFVLLTAGSPAAAADVPSKAAPKIEDKRLIGH